MKLDRLAQWLTIVSNLGVIGGFVLLAMQMRQNTTAIELQSHNDYVKSFADIELAQFGDATAPAITKAMLAPATLGDDDILRLWLFFDSELAAAYKVWNAHRAGQTSDAAWEDARQSVVYMLSSDAARVVWNGYKSIYERPFADAIDADLAQSGNAYQDQFRGIVAGMRRLAPPAADPR